MPAIKVRENEPFDIALRRFRRLCDRAGVAIPIEAIQLWLQIPSIKPIVRPKVNLAQSSSKLAKKTYFPLLVKRIIPNQEGQGMSSWKS